SVLHPADRRFGDAECTIFRRSLFDELSPSAFWVNPPEAAVRANRKLLQQRVALESGLEAPSTLYTNDPHEIREFIRSNQGQVDWRKAYEEIVMESFQVPPSITRCCIDTLKKLGIVFGCFDFVVTPQGSYAFLEVNEMGQFLFVEHFTGLPLLNAFSEFLSS